MPHGLWYVRKYRGLPFVKRGMIVEVCGERGRITDGNSSGNLNIRFKGKKRSENCHPHWQTVYFDDEGNILADYRE